MRMPPVSKFDHQMAGLIVNRNMETAGVSLNCSMNSLSYLISMKSSTLLGKTSLYIVYQNVSA